MPKTKTAMMTTGELSLVMHGERVKMFGEIELALWCHDAVYDPELWEAYRDVNERYADAARQDLMSFERSPYREALQAVQKIKEYIAAGLLGQVYYVYSQRLNLGNISTVVKMSPNSHAVSCLPH